MSNTIISRSFFILFVVALAAVPVLMIFMPTNARNQKIALNHDTQLLAKLQQIELSITPTPSRVPTTAIAVEAPIPSITAKKKPTASPTKAVPVTITPQPTYVASIVQDQESSAWNTYKSGSVVNGGFSFTYPSTWNATYKKDDSQANAYAFMFNNSQVMTVQMYKRATTADAFIAANYPDKLTSEEFGKIGNDTLYRLTPKASLNADDQIYTEFGSRGLVLGEKYAYTISFDSNPDHAMINLIEQIIWPNLTFK